MLRRHWCVNLWEVRTDLESARKTWDGALVQAAAPGVRRGILRSGSGTEPRLDRWGEQYYMDENMSA